MVQGLDLKCMSTIWHDGAMAQWRKDEASQGGQDGLLQLYRRPTAEIGFPQNMDLRSLSNFVYMR
jgi:hypothetical protein